MMSKKGQAAMEFLMTYGWAILIAIIAIAALIAFGVLNPGKSSANVCGTSNAITTGIGCTPLKATTAGGLYLFIENGVGQDFESVTTLIGSGCVADSGNPGSLIDGAKGSFNYTGCDCINGRLKTSMNFTYTITGEMQHIVNNVPLNVRCESA